MRVRIILDGTRYLMKNLDDPASSAFILNGAKPKHWTKRSSAEKYATARGWEIE